MPVKMDDSADSKPTVNMRMPNKRHYRVTRPRAYGPGTPGFTDPSNRQGYYVDALSANDARDRIRASHGFSKEEPLDVSLWRDYDGMHIGSYKNL